MYYQSSNKKYCNQKIRCLCQKCFINKEEKKIAFIKINISLLFLRDCIVSDSRTADMVGE